MQEVVTSRSTAVTHGGAGVGILLAGESAASVVKLPIVADLVEEEDWRTHVALPVPADTTAHSAEADSGEPGSRKNHQLEVVVVPFRSTLQLIIDGAVGGPGVRGVRAAVDGANHRAAEADGSSRAYVQHLLKGPLLGAKERALQAIVGDVGSKIVATGLVEHNHRGVGGSGVASQPAAASISTTASDVLELLHHEDVALVRAQDLGNGCPERRVLHARLQSSGLTGVRLLIPGDVHVSSVLKAHGHAHDASIAVGPGEGDDHQLILRVAGRHEGHIHPRRFSAKGILFHDAHSDGILLRCA
mmetsp:Transcript_133826/g.317186  ORF Transcript_133826/g.317186 Transcript_133826/m.317186 type:complete len:302 (+) Transcript_133826:2358-3263(+)